MAHMRQQIRQAVKALLAGLPTSGARVYPSKRLPWDSRVGQLPGIAIYTDVESSEIADREGRMDRDLTITLEMAASGADEAVEDTLDTMAAEVEAAIAADKTLGGLAAWCRLVRTVPPTADYQGAGDATAVKRLEYAVRYATLETDATAAA